MIILRILSLLLFFSLVFAFFRTYQTQHGETQKLFLAGKIPKPDLNGFYKGHLNWYQGNWQGKTFDASKQSGVNMFKEGDKEIPKYPFTTSVGKGLRDDALDVVKLDYDMPENPFWVRILLDEVVEVEDGRYLGKLHVRVYKNFAFTLGYFKLGKE